MNKAIKTKKIPKLRFPEFSGEWEEKRLGDLLFIERGASPRPISRFITRSEDGIPWIKIGDIKEGDKYITITAEKVTQEGARKSRKVKVGDFILSNSMSFGRPYILKIDGCIHDGWLLLRNVNKNILFNNFLYEVLGSENIKRKFLSLAAGSTVKNLKSETVRETKIFLPSLPEQQKIANFLSAVDERIKILRAKREALVKYKKGIMQKIFPASAKATAGRPAKDEKVPEIRFKDDNGKDFPEWEEKRLGEIVEINKGKQLNKIDLLENGQYPSYSGGIEPSGYTNQWNTSKNTIIISEGGNSCGYVNFITKNFWAGGHCYTLEKLKPNINKIFLYQFLKYSERLIMRLRVGSGLPNIQKKDLLRFKIFAPSISEQQKIANFLSTIDKKIELVDAQIQKMQEWKRGLMQGLFV